MKYLYVITAQTSACNEHEVSRWIILFTFPNKWLHIVKKKKSPCTAGLKGVFHNMFKSQTGLNLHYKIWSFLFYIWIYVQNSVLHSRRKEEQTLLQIRGKWFLLWLDWVVTFTLFQAKWGWKQRYLTAHLACFFDFMYFWSYWILVKQITDLFSPEYAFHKHLSFVMTGRLLSFIYLFSFGLKVK